MDWFTTFIAWLKRLSPLRALEHGAWLIAHSIVVEFTDAETGRLRANVDPACFALVDRCLRKAHQALDLLVLARAHQRLGLAWRPLFRATRLDQDLRAGPFDPARLRVRARDLLARLGKLETAISRRVALIRQSWATLATSPLIPAKAGTQEQSGRGNSPCAAAPVPCLQKDPLIPASAGMSGCSLDGAAGRTRLTLTLPLLLDPGERFGPDSGRRFRITIRAGPCARLVVRRAHHEAFVTHGQSQGASP